jgi:prefoldin subunit 5
VGLLATRDYVLDLEKEMKALREMKQTIRSLSVSGDEKRDMLVEIGRMENNLTANIQEVKKTIASMK